MSYLSQGLGIGNYAPFEPAAVDIGDGKLSLKSRVVAGDYLTALNDGNSYRYWVGVYAEQANLQAKGWLLEKLADDETFANY